MSSESPSSISSSASTSRSSSPQPLVGKLSGRQISPHGTSLGIPVRALSSEGSLLLSDHSYSSEPKGIFRRISSFAQSVITRRSSSSTSTDIDFSLERTTLSLRDKFRNNKNPKLLLIPESHDSKETREARKFIAENSERFYAFSEGEDGQKALGGVRGIETQANFEIAPVLREYLSQKDYRPNQLPQDAISTEEEVYRALRGFGVSKDVLKLVKKKFFKAKTPEEQVQAITFFQIHFRDKMLTEAITQECRVLKDNPGTTVGVGFFGAAHLVDGHDDDDDKRTMEERIPDLLQETGTPGDECIQVHGVDVYVYPHVLSGDKLDEEFLKFFD